MRLGYPMPLDRYQQYIWQLAYAASANPTDRQEPRNARYGHEFITELIR